MGREFRCDARALIPRPETEELVERILGRVKRQGGAPPQAVLDMGTGSGVIGLSLAAAWPEARVVLADMSPDALALAQENAEALGLAGERLTFLLTDLCAALGGRRFHVVAANLPYIDPDEIPGLAPEVQRDPLLALDGGPGGTAVIRRFLDALPPHLEPGALLALEVGEGQTAALAEGLRAAGFEDVAAESDLGQRDRFVFARWP
jgi:release factor glutamine methyltransferase